MCGIAGFSGTFHPDFLARANEILIHRGPDDAGVWFDAESKIGLAHRRLSIIDLTKAAAQPMQNATGTLHITFNGEIYNYRELRKRLKDHGCVFRTRSDTEVLLSLYEVFGQAMLNHLNGIFAFAIWDAKKQELFAARDHLGVKPFYYSETPKGFLFASELKALLSEESVDCSLNVQALHDSITYLWCPAPKTMLKSISKLEPGFALIVKGGKIAKKWRYYDIPWEEPFFKESEEELEEALREKIHEAVRRQMVSDVPVGAFLSGGVDSSAVVAVAKQKTDTLHCFTIGFENSKGLFDGFAEDLPYAKKVAETFQVPLHVVTVGDGMMQSLERMILHLDEPQADPAPLNALFICELARQQGIKVLLSGAGGDDVFSGYRRHVALQSEGYWAWLPRVFRRALRVGSSKLPQHKTFGRRAAKAFRYADHHERDRLIGYFVWLDENLQNTLYSPAVREQLRGYSAMDPLRETLKQIPHDADPLNQMLYLEMKHFLSDHNLNYTDKMGMASGVEVRVPLLDIELVRFAAKIPPNLKQKGNVGKYLFRKAVAPLLPPEILTRPKSGFGAPLRAWLHGGALKPMVEELLSDTALKRRGLFNPVSVKKLISDDLSGKVDAGYTIFSLMVLEWWMRIFLDRNSKV